MSDSNFKRPTSQFAVNKTVIFEQIEAGIFLKEIFDQLVAEKKFTGEYSHFCRLVRNEKKRIEENKNEIKNDENFRLIDRTKEELKNKEKSQDHKTNKGSDHDNKNRKFFLDDPYNR